MKPCAIVLLNYNGETVLPTFLPSVVTHSSNDLWMIDNASSDKSLEYVSQAFPQVNLISLESNHGFTGGYNFGLEQLRGKYANFILINTDLEVTPGWDQGLLNFLEKNGSYAAVQPKILSWKDKSHFDYAGAGGGFLDALGYPYCRGRIWNHLEADHGQYDDTLEVDWASGACLAIRADDFFTQEGFDLDFFAHMEEIDLCWRLRQSGRKIGYLGSVTVYHLGGATLDRGSARKLLLNIRNSLSMVYKNAGFARFIGIFLIKAALETLAALQYLLKGQAGFAKAIAQGYADFLRSSKKKQMLTMPNQKTESTGPVRFIFVHQLFRGVKKFTEL
ncbi:MAG: glycosyltransferase family 2 protein [Bacteroidetes bacterium]|nr:glycosyltransferase family 2 protein [Bacteroidota bacterium]